MDFPKKFAVTTITEENKKALVKGAYLRFAVLAPSKDLNTGNVVVLFSNVITF